MFKYCFYILLLTLLIDCGNGGGTYKAPNAPAGGTINNQPGQCFYVLMDIAHAKNYELFLSEAPYVVCNKNGKVVGPGFVGVNFSLGTESSCNYLAQTTPYVQIAFDLQFTKIQKFQVHPRNINRMVNAPVLFQTNAVIEPQNKDKGWGARITPANIYRGGYIDFYCEYCDFNEDRYMSIKVKYRGQELGSISLNPKSTIARCPSATTPPHAHPK